MHACPFRDRSDHAYTFTPPSGMILYDVHSVERINLVYRFTMSIGDCVCVLTPKGEFIVHAHSHCGVK